MKKIVFVCTGNTCRSPMAEALFLDIIKERSMDNEFEVCSRGVYAFSGDPASHQAIEVMKKEFCLDLKKHRATVLDGSDIEEASIILTMTLHHKNMIIDIYPEAVHKVFTLKEYASRNENMELENYSNSQNNTENDTEVFQSQIQTDVIDPFGGDYEVYKDCAFEIEGLLLEVIDRI